MEVLKAQVAALTRMLEDKAKPSPTPTPAPAATPGAPQGGGSPAPEGSGDKPVYEQEIAYGLQIPPDLAQALSSDDDGERISALNFLINGVAKAVHTRVRAEALSLRDAVRSEIGQAISGHDQQRQVQAMRESYFSAFPTHRNPATELIIQQELAALIAAQPDAQWDTNFVNALGSRVNAKLAELAATATPTPAPAPAPSPAPRPAPMLPAGGRGGSPAPAAASTQQDVLDELFGP